MLIEIHSMTILSRTPLVDDALGAAQSPEVTVRL